MAPDMDFKSPLFAFSLLLVFTAGQAAAATEMGFTDYVNAALGASETVRVNQAQKSVAEAREAQATATVLPQLKLIGTKSRQDVSQSPKLTADSTALRLNLTQPILGLYKKKAALDVAAQQTVVITETGEDAVSQFKLSLNDAFHAVIIAIGDLGISQELSTTAAKRAKETAARARTGRTRPADSYLADAQLATSQAQVEQAKVFVSSTRSALAQLSGLPIDTVVTDQVRLPPAPESVDSYLANLKTLPAIKSLAAQKSAIDAQTDAARAERLPDLDFFSNYYLHRDNPYDKVKWDAGLQLTWSIYDGGLTSGKVREARAQYQAIDLQESQKNRVTESKIRQYHEQLNASLRQIPSLEKAMALTKKNYTAIERDYSVGVATIFDVIQSSNTLADARRQYDHQIVNAKATYVALKLAAGQPL